MKYQIRRGVFETNSSSMHSISIMGADRIKKDDFPDEIVIVGGEYGWSGPVMVTPEDKLNYMATEYWEDEDMLERIRRVYEKYTGKKLSYDLPEEYYGIYIDHQSFGTVNEFLRCGIYENNNLNEALTDLIFNENKMIIIDNDN